MNDLNVHLLDLPLYITAIPIWAAAAYLALLALFAGRHAPLAGMCFSTALLLRVAPSAFSIVEDIEYGLALGRPGVRVADRKSVV